MGGGDTRETVISTGSQGPYQPPTALQPYYTRMGQQALAALDYPQLQLSQFAAEHPLFVPGFTPLEQLGQQQTAARSYYGVPVPVPEQQAYQQAVGLPVAAGLPVPMSTYMPAAYATAQQLATQGGVYTPEELAGISSMQQFATGPVGQSPAFTAARQGFEAEVRPMVENAMARMNLAQSPQLPLELSRAYAKEMVPLYSQALTQQQQAGQALFQAGGTVADRNLRSLQALRDTQMSLGQTEQALNTEAQMRQLQATMAMVPELRGMGLREEQRPVEAIQQAMAVGQQERAIEQARAQAEQEAYERRRQLAMFLVNPLQGITFGGSSTAGTQTGETSGGGGLGLFK